MVPLLGVWEQPDGAGAVYVGHCFDGHQFWTMADGARDLNMMINFYKNLSIVGDRLLLSITGPGKYSLPQV
jgi:putative oxidoreductase